MSSTIEDAGAASTCDSGVAAKTGALDRSSAGDSSNRSRKKSSASVVAAVGDLMSPKSSNESSEPAGLPMRLTDGEWLAAATVEGPPICAGAYTLEAETPSGSDVLLFSTACLISASCKSTAEYAAVGRASCVS